jgi:hypothetical protein
VTHTLGPAPSALYSPRQIALAAFLGSPLAAGWFFRRNFLTLADERRATRSLWMGVGITVVLAAVAFVLPTHFPNEILPVLYTAAIHQYASGVFDASFKKYIGEGGPKGSWWAVVGVSVGALLFLFGALIVLALAVPSLFPR